MCVAGETAGSKRPLESHDNCNPNASPEQCRNDWYRLCLPKEKGNPSPRARSAHWMISSASVRTERPFGSSTGLTDIDYLCPFEREKRPGCKVRIESHLPFASDARQVEARLLSKFYASVRSNASPEQHKLRCYPLHVRM